MSYLSHLLPDFRKRSSIKNLGAFSTELVALSSFFDSPWQMPVVGLTENAKASVLSSAGFILLALGRLKEATRPMQAGLEAFISQKNWQNAATSAGNLSETYLIIGDLSQALIYAQQSVEFADQSGDSYQQISTRTILADTLHQAGRFLEAESTFRAAENIQKEWQPKHPILYAVHGFRYCDLLITQGKYQEVQSRARQTLAWVMPHGLLLAIALDHLSIGRSFLLQARLEANDYFALATDYLKQAVDELRQAGTLHYLSRGLITRAGLYRMKNEYARAQSDLEEAMSIALRGSMGRFEADCHLEYTWLYLVRGEREKARKSWTKAKEMIKRMGYHKWDKDLQEIWLQIGNDTP